MSYVVIPWDVSCSAPTTMAVHQALLSALTLPRALSIVPGLQDVRGRRFMSFRMRLQQCPISNAKALATMSAVR